MDFLLQVRALSRRTAASASVSSYSVGALGWALHTRDGSVATFFEAFVIISQLKQSDPALDQALPALGSNGLPNFGDATRFLAPRPLR